MGLWLALFSSKRKVRVASILVQTAAPGGALIRGDFQAAAFRVDRQHGSWARDRGAHSRVNSMN